MQTQPLPPVVIDAVCPEHPGQSSTGTCQRCGRFVCASCQLAEGSCSACWRRQLGSLPSGRLRLWLAMGLIGLAGFVSLLRVALTVWLLTRFGEGLPLDEDLERYSELHLFFYLPTTVGVVGGGIALISWLYRTVKSANALGLSQEEPQWVVFCWFVPLFNLIKPYHVVRDLWLDLGGARQGTWLVTAWWTSLLLQFVVNRVGEVLLLLAEEEPMGYHLGLLSLTGAELLAVASAVLCIHTLRMVQHQLDLRRVEAAKST